MLFFENFMQKKVLPLDMDLESNMFEGLHSTVQTDKSGPPTIVLDRTLPFLTLPSCDIEELDDNSPFEVSVPMDLIRNDRATSLMHGYIAGPKEFGPVGPYVLVPSGWSRPDDEYIGLIFEALGIPIPPLAFLTMKCHEIFPDLGLERKKLNLQHSNNEDFFDVIYENPTDDQKSLFKVVMESRLESIMKAISNSFVQCNAIYLCQEAFYGNKFVELLTKSLPPKGVALAVRSCLRFENAVAESLKQNAKPLSDTIINAVKWSKKPALASLLTHFLIFEDEADEKYFMQVMKRQVPMGLFCIGGTNPLLDAALEALSTGMPIFAFKYTLVAGHALCSLLDYYNEVYKQRKHITATTATATTVIASAVTSSSSSVLSIEERLIPNEQDIFGLKFLPELFPKCQRVAYNWPENFNEDAALKIDPLKDKPQELLLGIINLMASVQSSPSELGGGTAESEAIQQAVAMYTHIHRMESNYRQLAKTIWTIIQILIFAITCISVISTEYMTHKNEDNVILISNLKSTNTVLPIVLGIIMTIYASLSPQSNWALMTLSKNRVLSELYKYRCRVGPYRPQANGDGGPSHRTIFTEKLSDIWSELETSDIAMKPKNNNKNDNNGNPNLLLENLPNGIIKNKDKIEFSLDNLRQKHNRQRQIDYKNDNNNNNINNNIKNGTDASTLLAIDMQQKKLLLSADEYINERLRVEMDRLENESPALKYNYRILQVMIIIVSSIGAIFAAYDLQLWIPLLFAFSNSQEGIIKFFQLPLKSQRSNASYAALNKILLWWTSLTLIEKSVRTNKHKLVCMVENIISSDIEILTQAQFKHDKNDSNEDSNNNITTNTTNNKNAPDNNNNNGSKGNNNNHSNINNRTNTNISTKIRSL